MAKAQIQMMCSNSAKLEGKSHTLEGNHLGMQVLQILRNKIFMQN